MDELKLTVSEATVEFLDECVEHFSLWHYDAINIPELLLGLVNIDNAFLREYLIEEDVDSDDFDAFLPMYCSNHMNQLKIKPNDSYDGMTQEQVAKLLPNNFVPNEEDDTRLDNDELKCLEDDSEESDSYEGPSTIEELDAEIASFNSDFDDEVVEEAVTMDDEAKSLKAAFDGNSDSTTEDDSQTVSEDTNTQYIVIRVKNHKIENFEISAHDPSKKLSSKDVETKKETEQYKTERNADIIFRDVNGKNHWYPVSNEFMKLIDIIRQMAKESGFSVIEPAHFTVAMFKHEPPVLKEFFKDIEIEFLEAKKFFTSNTIWSLSLIPLELKSFMRCLNDDVDVSKPCEILMRDDEVNKIWNICHKMTKRNTVIIGEAGVGKSALIEKITYDIVAGTCPRKFKNFSVISLDVNSLIAGTSYRGDAEERIKGVIEFLEKHDNVILFIDEVHTILGAGSCFEGEMDFANALKPILARGKTIVIGATTNDEYEAYFAQDAALSRRFETVIVEEPESSKVYTMIENKVKTLSDYHNVKISRKMIEYIIMISNCFNFEKKNPDKTLDLIDRSLVSAELKGKKRVDKNDVLSNYDIYFKRFACMSEKTKKETAYHEVGHYVFIKLSDKLIDYKLLAVSIMPAENYLGVTCYEERKDIVPHTNRDYFIDEIAKSLAGRVCEKLYTGDLTSGASTDLRNATQIAHEVITKLGMTSDKNERNLIFLNTEDHPMYSEKYINMINHEVEDLIELAKTRAEEVIYSHQDLVKALVDSLMENHIMSEEQIDVICKQYIQ